MKCPFCAEEIRKDAIKCKHCQSDITAIDVTQEITNSNLEIKNKEGINKNLVLFIIIAFILESV